MRKLIFICAALLAGCGGGGGGSDMSQGAGTATLPPPTVTDAFITTVKSLVTSMADDSEPAAVEVAPAAATPDDTEPVAVAP